LFPTSRAGATGELTVRFGAGFGHSGLCVAATGQAVATVASVITIVDPEGRHELAGNAHDGRLWAEPADLARVTGWQLKPEGLCRDEVCIPLSDGLPVLSPEGLVEIGGFAASIGREVVVDADHAVAAIGDSATAVAESMASLEAPEFTLPDLDGTPVSLHDFDRRKRLLLAWSSW
jgi:hypothetical protein